MIEKAIDIRHVLYVGVHRVDTKYICEVTPKYIGAIYARSMYNFFRCNNERFDLYCAEMHGFKEEKYKKDKE